AHEATLKFKGNTISVLGSGFNHIYPKENKNLYEEIKNKGLIITGYPPNTKPERYDFPERNRIISGLSKGTIVVEYGERSGTLITVDQELEQGKEVYVVTGNLLSIKILGTNKLLEQGVKLILNNKKVNEYSDKVILNESHIEENIN